ncbi:MAG: hypothetical protein K2P04_00650, partial [Oscillospiraceae bacterium]|nr:hypothetical protein [Oscillospiraceae bacterium]
LLLIVTIACLSHNHDLSLALLYSLDLIKQKHKVSPSGRCSRNSQTVGLSAFLPTFAAQQK